MSQGSRKSKGSYFVSTISIALVLVVVGSLVFILLNARRVSEHVRRNVGFLVIIQDHANEMEIKRVQKILDTKPYTYVSRFVTKEQAAQDLKKELGEDFETILGGNPLLPSIEIQLNPAYVNNDSLAKIERGLAKYDIIHEVYYQKSMVQRVNENIRRIAVLLLIVGGVLMLISFTLIRNTIHLAIYSQRFLIKTMQLVGARPFFICKPFVYGCVWRGFWGALLANVVLLGGIFFLQESVGDMIRVVYFDALGIMVGSVVFCGIVLSFLSAWYSVRHYLKRNMDDLYFN